MEPTRVNFEGGFQMVVDGRDRRGETLGFRLNRVAANLQQ